VFIARPRQVRSASTLLFTPVTQPPPFKARSAASAWLRSSAPEPTPEAARNLWWAAAAIGRAAREPRPAPSTTDVFHEDVQGARHLGAVLEHARPAIVERPCDSRAPRDPQEELAVEPRLGGE
jgi:hypothetical protein